MRVQARLLLDLIAVTTVIAALMWALGPTGDFSPSSRERAKEFAEEHPERLGVAEISRPVELSPAAGWAGEKVFGNGNDWEPAVAADPSAPYVYMATTRYNAGGAACGSCPVPYIVYRVSADNGATFGPVEYLCPCSGVEGQFDPLLETDDAGNLYAAWMNWDDIMFSKSTDHGQTWSTPEHVNAGTQWGDKPWLAVSPNGQHVYIGWQRGNLFVASSHDGGATFDPPVLATNDGGTHYLNGGWADNAGNVVFSGQGYSNSYRGNIDVYVLRSNDGGDGWYENQVDISKEQPPCRNRGCPFDHFGGQASLAGDDDGNLVLAYTRAARSRGSQSVIVRRSSDAGLTWTGRQRVSPRPPRDRLQVASFPALAADDRSGIRLWYMDNRRGNTDWNVWYRQSVDGGATWSNDKRISDAHGGARYKDRGGFRADYGDYGEVAITSAGTSFAAWGEGFSYYGPGNTWYNRQI